MHQGVSTEQKHVDLINLHLVSLFCQIKTMILGRKGLKGSHQSLHRYMILAYLLAFNKFFLLNNRLIIRRKNRQISWSRWRKVDLPIKVQVNVQNKNKRLIVMVKYLSFAEIYYKYHLFIQSCSKDPQLFLFIIVKYAFKN